MNLRLEVTKHNGSSKMEKIKLSVETTFLNFLVNMELPLHWLRQKLIFTGMNDGDVLENTSCRSKNNQGLRHLLLIFRYSWDLSPSSIQEGFSFTCLFHNDTNETFADKNIYSVLRLSCHSWKCKCLKYIAITSVIFTQPIKFLIRSSKTTVQKDS